MQWEQQSMPATAQHAFCYVQCRNKAAQSTAAKAKTAKARQDASLKSFIIGLPFHISRGLSYFCCAACVCVAYLRSVQDQPPAACSQLLTSSAFRKLNVEALNQLTVNTFVDKQADASPQDMAGLMAALALVRCCSSFNQVRCCDLGNLHWTVVAFSLKVLRGFRRPIRSGFGTVT